MRTSLLCILCLICFTSCEKDRIEEDEETVNYYNSPDDYLDSKQDEEQEFVIENEDGNEPIQGKDGSKIWITKDCLEFPDGSAVDFPYTVKLIELYTVAEMIYHRMPTVASGNILETRGEARVRAFKEDAELQLKNSCPFWLFMPDESPLTYMNVYYGIEGGEVVNWTKEPGLANTPTTFPDTDTGYTAPIYKLGWVNCDFQVGDGTGSKITFTSTTDELTNLRIFIHIPAYHTVMMVRDLISDPIPTGAEVNVICIGIDGSGQLFHYYEQRKIAGGDIVNVIMSPITDPDLTILLSNLQ